MSTVLARAANNLLVLGILAGFFWLIYAGMKKGNVKGSFKKILGMFGKKGK